MLLLSDLILIIILATCIFAGLDKLIAITLFVCILFLSLQQELRLSTESKLVTKYIALSKGKFTKEKSIKHFKIASCFIFFISWLTILSEVICLASGHGLSIYDSFNSKLFCVCTYLVLYFYAVFATRTIHEDDTTNNLLPEAQYYRMLQYLSVYLFIFGVYFIAIDSFGFSEDIREKYLYVIYDDSIFFLLAYLFCLLLERLFDTGRILACLLKSDKKYTKFKVPFFVGIIASSKSFKDSLIKTIELISGVDLSKSEIARYILIHIEPVTIIALTVFWLLSSIVIVPPDKEAIFFRMGKIAGSKSFKPGLHFKLPWPLERMELYQPNLIKTINVGFTPDPNQKHIIWSKSHATENFSLLVGNGVEIIAVDCQIFYKVNDLYKFIKKVQNPEAYIEALAYKILTANTVSKTFNQIISENRDALISDLRTKLQDELNKEDLGVTIVEVVFLAIHPPLEVADVYEDVISAQVDKQTSILKAKSSSIKEICMKKAFAEGEINKAKSYAETTVANAIGEAVSFESRIIGYNTDSNLEEFRLKLDSIQKMAKSKNLYIIDKSYMRKNDRIMLNLQN